MRSIDDQWSEDARLVGGDHELDVNICVLAALLLEQFQSLLDQVSHVLVLPLAVLDLVSDVF